MVVNEQLGYLRHSEPSHSDGLGGQRCLFPATSYPRLLRAAPCGPFPASCYPRLPRGGCGWERATAVAATWCFLVEGTGSPLWLSLRPVPLSLVLVGTVGLWPLLEPVCWSRGWEPLTGRSACEAGHIGLTWAFNGPQTVDATQHGAPQQGRQGDRAGNGN